MSPHTVSNYQRQLEKICIDVGLDDWSYLTTDTVKKVLQHAKMQGLSSRSINLRLTVLRTFCRFLVAKQVLPNNPVDTIQSVKQNKKNGGKRKAGPPSKKSKASRSKPKRK